jgi:hypothetical protein
MGGGRKIAFPHHGMARLQATGDSALAPSPACDSCCPRERRALLKAALGSGLSLLLPERVAAQSDPRNQRPQEGDRFVFAGGDRKGAAIALSDVPLRATPINAYPQDPASGTVRDASRLNQVMFMRLPEAELAEATRNAPARGTAIENRRRRAGRRWQLRRTRGVPDDLDRVRETVSLAPRKWGEGWGEGQVSQGERNDVT